MATQDKNGCLHSEENGRFINKTDTEIFEAMCKVFRVDDNVKDKRKALIRKVSKDIRITARENWVDRNFGQLEDYHRDNYANSILRPSIFVNPNHWSRLQTMFSDYHRGASKPKEKNGTIYFNVDNSLYLTEGAYPYFRVYDHISFSNTFVLEEFLKEL